MTNISSNQLLDGGISFGVGTEPHRQEPDIIESQASHGNMTV